MKQMCDYSRVAMCNCCAGRHLVTSLVSQEEKLREQGPCQLDGYVLPRSTFSFARDDVGWPLQVRLKSCTAEISLWETCTHSTLDSLPLLLENSVQKSVRFFAEPIGFTGLLKVG